MTRANETEILNSAGAGKHRHHHGGLASAISGLEAEYRREGDPGNQRDDRRHPFGIADVVRDGGLRSAGCLRQRREPIAGPLAFAESRNKHSRSARRRTLAHYQAITYGKHFARRSWRSRRIGDRDLGDRFAESFSAEHSADQRN